MQPGLEGVVAAETVLSTADPKRHMLWMRGVPVPTLVADYGYEGTIALLWQGFAPGSPTRESLRMELGAARVAAFGGLSAWLGTAAGRPMDEAVRRCMGELADDA